MLKRYWINQPSTLQPDHHCHGLNVLADIDTAYNGICYCYPASGHWHSFKVSVSSLSLGWLSEPKLTKYKLCCQLAEICDIAPDNLVDMLTGYLWSEEEAGDIKANKE